MGLRSCAGWEKNKMHPFDAVCTFRNVSISMRYIYTCVYIHIYVYSGLKLASFTILSVYGPFVVKAPHCRYGIDGCN